MKTFEYTITDPQGIHARPAGELVKIAQGFESSVTLEKDGKRGDAKRIFAVMGLCAKQGSTLKVSIEGADEETAAAALEQFLKENL